jgi:hypothetical protein
MFIGKYRSSSRLRVRCALTRFSGALASVVAAIGVANGQPAFVSNDFDGDGVADVIARQRAFDVRYPVIGEIVLFSGATKAEIRRIVSDRENDLFAYSVAAIGDIDADGHDDIAVGAPMSSIDYQVTGRVDVYSGFDGDLLLQIDGSPGSRFGRSVGPAGDMDGDGVPDFLVGAYVETEVGRMCVALALSGADGGVLRTFGGEDMDDGFGAAVLGVGDWNADGFPEIAITSPALLNPQNAYGRLYIFHGSAIGAEPDYVAADTAAIQVDGDGAIKQVFGRNLIMGLDRDADGHGDLAVLSLIDWSGSGVVSAKSVSRTGTVLASVAAERKLVGDVDKSMDVVIADLVTVLNGLGLEPDLLDPFSIDSDGDGVVDGQDINAILSQFGATSSLKDVIAPGGATTTMLAFAMRPSDDCDLLLAGRGEDCCAECPPSSLFPCGSPTDPLAPGDPIDDCDNDGGPRPPGSGPRPPRPGNPSGGGCDDDDNNDGIPNKYQQDSNNNGSFDAFDCESECFEGNPANCEPRFGGGFSGWPSAPPSAFDPPPPPPNIGPCAERVFHGFVGGINGLDGAILQRSTLLFVFWRWPNVLCGSPIAWDSSSGDLIEFPEEDDGRYVYVTEPDIGRGSVSGTCVCGDSLHYTLADIALAIDAPEVSTGVAERPIASYLFVNNDDDDYDGIVDHSDPEVNGEDDFYRLHLGPVEGVNPASFNETTWRLTLSGGLKAWYRLSQGDLHAELVRPSDAPPFEERTIDGEMYRTVPLSRDIRGVPRLRDFLLEAVAPSTSTTSMAVYLGFGGTYQLTERASNGEVVTASAWIASTAQVVAAEVEIVDHLGGEATSLAIGNWGRDEPQHSLSGYDQNDALLNDEVETFIDMDPDRFKVTVRDASRNVDPAFEDQIVVEVSTTRNFEDGAPVDDDPTTVRLVETGPDTGVFDSELMLLVTRDLPSDPPGWAAHWADDDLEVWSEYEGALVPDEADGDRTHRVDLNGTVVIALDGDGPDTRFERRLKVARRFPDESTVRTVYVVPIVHMEPYRDWGFDHDDDPTTDFIGANNEQFDFVDSDANGRHDRGERSEAFRDLSTYAHEVHGNMPPQYTYGHEPVPFADGYGQCYSDSEIDAQVERADIAWAQAEIRVVREGIAVLDAPIGPGGVSILDDGWFNPSPLNGDLWNSIALFGPTVPDKVYVIFTGPLADIGYGGTLMPSSADPAHPLAEHTFVMIEPVLSYSIRVLAHEIGHALTNLGDAEALGIHINPSYVFFPSLNTQPDFNGSFRRILHGTEVPARTVRQSGDLLGVGSRLLHE